MSELEQRMEDQLALCRDAERRADSAEMAMVEMEERLDNCERDGVEQRDRADQQLGNCERDGMVERDRAEQQLVRDHREVHTRDHCYFSRSKHTLTGRSRKSCGERRGLMAVSPAEPPL